jgi:hypothetical protein
MCRDWIIEEYWQSQCCSASTADTNLSLSPIQDGIIFPAKSCNHVAFHVLFRPFQAPGSVAPKIARQQSMLITGA